jgi:hypothetical protein
MDTPRRLISAIATIGIPVTDQDRALGFYTQTLSATASNGSDARDGR